MKREISRKFYLILIASTLNTASPTPVQAGECETLNLSSQANQKEVEEFKSAHPDLVLDWSLLKKESWVVDGEVGVWETKINNLISHGTKSINAKFRTATKSSGRIKSHHVSQDGKAAALVLDLGKNRTVNCCEDEMCDVAFPTLLEGQTVIFLNLVKKEIVYVRKGLYLMSGLFERGGYNVHKSKLGANRKICFDFEPICPFNSDFQ